MLVQNSSMNELLYAFSISSCFGNKYTKTMKRFFITTLQIASFSNFILLVHGVRTGFKLPNGYPRVAKNSTQVGKSE